MTAIIACMKWGKRYGPDYVNRLFSAVRRNLTGDLRFLCFTDDTTGLDANVEAWPLPPIDLPEPLAWTPWRKLSLWQTPLADINAGDMLVLDLDLVVTGRLNEFFTYQPGDYCVIENWTQQGAGVGNTSAFRIPVGRYPEIYDRLMRDPSEVTTCWRIEQQYISELIPEQVFWPREWCLSFKYSILPRFPLNRWNTPRLPQDARIVAFTGKPDPDEALAGRWPARFPKTIYKHVRPTPWIGEHWR